MYDRMIAAIVLDLTHSRQPMVDVEATKAAWSALPRSEPLGCPTPGACSCPQPESS